MPRKPQLDWNQYQATYKVIVDANTVEKIEDLGVRAARLADALPLVGIFYQMFKKARIELAQHLKKKTTPDAPWTSKYLSILTVNSRAEGALAAFMTLAETALDDQAMGLKLRIQSVIEMMSHAQLKQLIVFPDPKAMSLEAIVHALNGREYEVDKKPRLLRKPKKGS